MATYWGEPGLMHSLSTTLGNSADELRGLRDTAVAVLSAHQYTQAGSTVSLNLSGAAESMALWAASIADRAERLDDPTFRHFSFVDGRPIDAATWVGGQVDPELLRFESWRQSFEDRALAQLADARSEREGLETQLAALTLSPSLVPQAVIADLERQLGAAILGELNATRQVVLALGGDPQELADLEVAITTLAYELFVAAPRPPIDEQRVTAATETIIDALNESWFGDVSRGELLTIQRTLADLSPAEFDAVVANLSDDEVYRWFSDLDGIRGGNLNEAEEADLFSMFATQGSAETLWRLTTAERGEKLGPIADAVLADAPPLVKMRYIEIAATEYDNDGELLVAMSGWAELDADETLAVAIALSEAGRLEQFGNDAQSLLEEIENGDGRDQWIPIEFLQGVVGGTWDALKGLSALTIQGLWDRHAFRKAWGGVGNLGALLFTDPAQFASTILDLETLDENPSYWAGQLVPALVGTKGLTKLARAGKLGTALKSLATKLDNVPLFKPRRQITGSESLDSLFQGTLPRASELMDWARAQGWTLQQTATGPATWLDGNGVKRLVIKEGSPRTPGSGTPHVEIRNVDGLRVDPSGNLVTRRSPGNHTPIIWDLP